MTPKQVMENSKLISRLLWLRAQFKNISIDCKSWQDINNVICSLAAEDHLEYDIKQTVISYLDNEILRAEINCKNNGIDLHGEWPQKHGVIE